MARPAEPLPPRAVPEIAGYLRRFGAGEAARLRYRERSRLLAATRAASPAAAASLLGQFDRPGAVQRAAVLERLVADAPLASLDAYAEITARAIVIATAGDPIHPSALARRLASALPHAELRVVPGKDESPRRHETAVRDAIAGFVACATLRRA
jgi:pimeloyl-ACP methyl ester carboxylesterase